MPNQIKVADQVTFTVKIVNRGLSPATGLRFTNILPEGFNFIPGKNKNFTFDFQTRELTWLADQGTTLPGGESLTLEYTVVVITSKVEAAQIIDAASVSADGLAEPSMVEARLLLTEPETSLTMMTVNNREANGLNGRVKLKFPENALRAQEAVSIRDLNEEPSENTDSTPWLIFELDVRAPANEDGTAPLSANAGIAAVTSEPSVQETVTPTPTPTGTEEPASPENDQIIPLEPIEAEFEQPVELTVSFDGLVDLAAMGADIAPFLVTLDKESGTWVRIPLKTIDREANTISADLTHFSTWGVGFGPTFPTNGANVLLFNQPYPSLFNGTTQYSMPIWTPPGRNGMQPDITLSYSSGTADGVLGDIQAPWVGMGWNIDSVEIARKITTGGCSPCGGGSYGYKNEFVLLFNGTGYELTVDPNDARIYHTKPESFLVIERHNQLLGNWMPLTDNTSGEWWEVLEKDGTRWRLGWSPDSEQLAAMRGYPGAATGAWATLGYAGYGIDVVAGRWRADQVLDNYSNRMTFTYYEEPMALLGTSAVFDRASYLSQIDYADHLHQPVDAGYSVVFVPESRVYPDYMEDVPAYDVRNEWDNFDTVRLDRIEVKYGSRTVRTYDLTYETRNYSDDGKTWQTTTLKSVRPLGTTEGGGTTAGPFVVFNYEDKNNRATHTGWQEWAYPRLSYVLNGWGGISFYTYEHDGRPDTSWYNWRVNTIDTTDSIHPYPMKTIFAYSAPCYNNVAAGPTGWCNASNAGELVGYGQTTVITKDFNGTTTLAVELHKFVTTADRRQAGREYELQNLDASGTTVLSKTVTNYYTYESSPGVYFTYANQVERFLDATLVGRTTYLYDNTYGTLTLEQEFNGATLYRQMAYEYVRNTNRTVWILDAVFRRTLKDGSEAVISVQEYGYNGNRPGVGVPMTTKPTLSRVVNGSQTIDTGYVYDPYGNVIETRLYKTYGNTGSLPSGSYSSYFTNYADDPATSEDDNLQTYVTSTANPLGQTARTHYDYGIGLPTIVTDLNGNSTTKAYDGLGRVLEVRYPGYSQANIQYTYPVPSPYTGAVIAPFAIEMKMWDETANPAAYRSAWQIMDGLGRVIQTQGPYETPGYLVLNDTSYNAQGEVEYSGLPRALSGTGGSHFAPNWGSVPHTTTTYDALKRVTNVYHPDGSVESFNYWWLRTRFNDRNGHSKVQQNDAFGRLAQVEEYTGSNPYTLYAATSYEYDRRDLLTRVIDANGNQTTITYDGFGRKIEMTDPDLGNWRYRYDTLGNLTAQIDAKRQATNLYYDNLNRLIGKTYTTGPVNPDTYQRPADPGYSGYTIKYYFDSGVNGLGRRTSMVDTSGTTTWGYNALGQPTNETHNIENTNYGISTSFDAFSRPRTQTLPNSEMLTYSYNAMGALSSLSGTDTYVSDIRYMPSGQVTAQRLGDSMYQQWCFNNPNSLRPSKLRAYANTYLTCSETIVNPRFNVNYQYQPNGNISQTFDVVRNETLNYSYDELDRLLSVNGAYDQTFTYDPTGNMMSKGVPTSPGTTNLAAWWGMDETSGTRSDSFGTSHLTDNNTVGATAGLRGNAASFVSANSEYLSRADGAAISTGNIDFTLIANVYLNSTSGVQIIANKGLVNTNSRDYALYSNGTSFGFMVGNGTVGGSVSSAPVITPGQWYTVVAWHDSVNNTLNIQVNNGPVSTANYSSGAIDSTYPLTIGAHNGGYSPFDGRIDDVALYKRVLTASERLWMYNNGKGRTYADLTSSNPGMANLSAWWSLNETSGTRSDNLGTSPLTDYNTVSYAPGLQVNAARFVPANLEFLSRADSAVLSTGNIDFTLVANVYMYSTSGIMVIANKGDKNNQNLRDYSLYFSGGAFGFRVGNGSTTAYVYSSQPVSAGAWYTIVAWHDAANNTLNIQVNNGTVNSASYSGGAMDTTYPLSIGAHSDGSYGLDGRIDEVALYKRVLTSDQRSWLYNNGMGRSYTDLFASSTPSGSSTYTYGDSAHKHAVTSLSTGESYSYDANGNMTCRVEGGVTYKQVYNIENLLTTVHKMNGTCASGTILETTQFVYDGDGNLVKKINPANSRSLYVGGLYEVDKDSGGSVTRTVTYYPVGGAMRIDGTLYFVLRDHLGSASVVTESDGDLVTGAEARYYPFGESRFSTASMLTDKLFTGQREMTDLGIYHYNARFYSPYINEKGL
jgi:uncharacterized repeat protein (TIGR01451 family)